ncbi:conjugative transposon protein TraM [Telluribacter sp.]|jgi:hypothetical protein|uniref:conjugative transposon protein TraM n=1 Tax=Telluribacter sp. TaxID=1978767 RepID=UPI002E12F756|nr:conjugative transposon protein TraM [Telluribacter sp.]
MSEKVDLKAEKAKQLSLPSRHIFRLLLPVSLLISVGFLGTRQGWIGSPHDTSREMSGVVMTIPEAKVKELDKEKKYGATSGEPALTDVNGIGISLDENSNINSRMLSGEAANVVGLDANTNQATQQLAREMGVGTPQGTPATYEAMKMTSQQKKNGMRNQQTVLQREYDRKVQTSINSMYRTPSLGQEEKRERERTEREEEQRLTANDKLLAILDKQIQQQNQGVTVSRIDPDLTIQAPQRTTESPETTSGTYEVMPYSRMVGTNGREGGNAFYSLNGHKISNTRPSRVGGSIRAVVHGDGDGITITNGTSVAVRMQEETVILIEGEPLVLPVNTLIYGVGRISGDRIDITVSTIRLENYLYTVNLVAYDLDGRKGLYVPDMKIKQQVQNALVQGSSQLANPGYIIGGSVGQQVGGQLASQGIGVALNAGKNLLNRKAQQARALVKPNYQLLLRSGNGPTSNLPAREDTDE